MGPDSLDPTWEETRIVLIDESLILRAQREILSCEECNPSEAETPFVSILDEITGCDPTVTDYVLAKPAKCPRCFREIKEKSLIERD